MNDDDYDGGDSSSVAAAGGDGNGKVVESKELSELLLGRRGVTKDEKKNNRSVMGEIK